MVAVLNHVQAMQRRIPIGLDCIVVSVAVRQNPNQGIAIPVQTDKWSRKLCSICILQRPVHALSSPASIYGGR